MKIQFLYSKAGEKEKLLGIYSEYQWFIDNNFPIILPKFYSEIYQKNKNNKKLFSKELNKKFDKIYNKNIYQLKTERVKNSWQKIEKRVFAVLKKLGLKIKDKYICYISLYGPSGQFKYPNIINLRISKSANIKEANMIIAHEIIHLMILNKARKNKLNYEQTEGLVDLFFTETNLKNVFPNYQWQDIARHDIKTFKKLFL